jgi:hypothetical protein
VQARVPVNEEGATWHYYFSSLKSTNEMPKRENLKRGRLVKSPRNFRLRLLACNLIDRHNFPHEPVDELRRIIYVSLKNVMLSSRLMRMRMCSERCTEKARKQGERQVQ